MILRQVPILVKVLVAVGVKSGESSLSEESLCSIKVFYILFVIIAMKNCDNESVDSKVNGGILVAVRIRPLSKKELESGIQSCCQAIGNTSVAIKKGGDQGGYLKSQMASISEYAFDTVFDEQVTQRQVYDGSVRSFIPNLVKGQNVTVFAYGATGAGKTHTMLGNTRADESAAHAEAGIIPHAVKDMFAQIAQKNKTLRFGESYNVSVCFMEVYNEQVYDLLESSGKVLSLREDQEREVVVVAGITEQTVTSYDQVMEYLAQGNKNRKTESTMANAVSSRSHAVLQINVKRILRAENGRESMIESKLSLIDLAGSERASATNNRGVRLLEGANINKSLLALANCINALAENSGSGKKLNVKYRDSKLTHLLKSSLEGNCNLVMIANVNPADSTYEDSLNTLKYANRAKNIKVNATVKESAKDTTWVEREARFREENAQLRARVKELEAKVKELTKYKHMVESGAAANGKLNISVEEEGGSGGSGVDLSVSTISTSSGSETFSPIVDKAKSAAASAAAAPAVSGPLFAIGSSSTSSATKQKSDNKKKHRKPSTGSYISDEETSQDDDNSDHAVKFKHIGKRSNSKTSLLSQSFIISAPEDEEPVQSSSKQQTPLLPSAEMQHNHSFFMSTIDLDMQNLVDQVMSDNPLGDLNASIIETNLEEAENAFMHNVEFSLEEPADPMASKKRRGSCVPVRSSKRLSLSAKDTAAAAPLMEAKPPLEPLAPTGRVTRRNSIGSSIPSGAGNRSLAPLPLAPKKTTASKKAVAAVVENPFEPILAPAVKEEAPVAEEKELLPPPQMLEESVILPSSSSHKASTVEPTTEAHADVLSEVAAAQLSKLKSSVRRVSTSSVRRKSMQDVAAMLSSISTDAPLTGSFTSVASSVAPVAVLPTPVVLVSESAPSTAREENPPEENKRVTRSKGASKPLATIPVEAVPSKVVTRRRSIGAMSVSSSVDAAASQPKKVKLTAAASPVVINDENSVNQSNKRQSAVVGDKLQRGVGVTGSKYTEVWMDI